MGQGRYQIPTDIASQILLPYFPSAPCPDRSFHFHAETLLVFRVALPATDALFPTILLSRKASSIISFFTKLERFIDFFAPVPYSFWPA